LPAPLPPPLPLLLLLLLVPLFDAQAPSLPDASILGMVQ
jgi:hypothetical protein